MAWATYSFLLLPLALNIILQIAPPADAAHLPLPPPIHCTPDGCTVESYQRIWYDRTPCRAARALYPTSEAELFEAVAWASRTGSKIKVVSKGSHSLPKLVCPGGDEGLLVSTEFYNSLIHVNHSSLTVTAHAGVMLRDLLDAIAAHGLTLTHTPYWQGVSVAGMISTGAHGSSLWQQGSAPHDYVVGLRLIIPSCRSNGYAQILDLSDGQDDLNAARLSLGVLGAISTVTFQLEPMFKRSVTLQLKGDDNLEDEILTFAQQHEFGSVNWSPSAGKALFKIDDRVRLDAEGDGAYKLAILDKMDVSYIESIRVAAETLEETQIIDELCEQEDALLKFRLSSGDGMINNGTTFTGYPVVGFNHNMQTAGGCEMDVLPLITARGISLNDPLDMEDTTELSMDFTSTTEALFTCFWNPLVNKTIVFFDTSISIPIDKAKDAILEIKKLRDVDPKAMCAVGQLGSFFFRFQKKSKAYLGESTDSLVFEFCYYRAKEVYSPRFQQDLFEEIEQLLLHKFGGKPHWGKNRPLAFEGMHSRTLAMDKFMEVKERYDPHGIFSSEWTDSILGSQAASHPLSLHDHCALEGLCVCREDSHCHPLKGYVCRPGQVYQEARVCRFETKELSS